ncbi:MAG: AEC family transporter [Desulfocapsaceae bacterium]|jgi:predicted permease|nr:AEC family transporter [Desulfocapsaceae bacterium]
MVSAFLNPIFPVFAIMLVGIVFARRGLFDSGAAHAINRFVFYVAVPALLFLLLARADLGNVDLRLLAVYFISEVILFATAALIARLLFKCAAAESILLGMASCFVNHVFFVLPIAAILYGEEATAPIGAIIAIDTTVIFAGTIMGLEFASHRSESTWRVLRSLLTNPVLVSIMTGLAVNVSGIGVHEGIVTFSSFAGAAAAPASLFSLGIILAGTRFFSVDYTAVMVTALKIVIHPLVVWLLFSSFFGVESFRPNAVLLVAAGPCGAMPFVLAMQYRVRAESIGLAVIYSTVASLFTLSIIA